MNSSSVDFNRQNGIFKLKSSSTINPSLNNRLCCIIVSSELQIIQSLTNANKCPSSIVTAEQFAKWKFEFVICNFISLSWSDPPFKGLRRSDGISKSYDLSETVTKSLRHVSHKDLVIIQHFEIITSTGI